MLDLKAKTAVMFIDCREIISREVCDLGETAMPSALSESCTRSAKPCGTTGRYKVELSAPVIWIGKPFSIRVTAFTDWAIAQATGGVSSGNLPLDDVSAFSLNGGNGILISGISAVNFTWSGVSVGTNSLTGVSNSLPAAAGATVVALPGPDTSYTGASASKASIAAEASNQTLALGVTAINQSDWKNGVATIPATVSGYSGPDGVTMVVAVQEEGLPSAGRNGADQAQLKVITTSFLVQPRVISITAGTSFDVDIYARDAQNNLDKTYEGTNAHDCDISIINSNGSFQLTSIAHTAWSQGKVTVNQTYNAGSPPDTNKTIYMKVKESGGTRAGSAPLMLGATSLTPTFSESLYQTGSVSNDGIDGWNQAFSNCLISTPHTEISVIAGHVIDQIHASSPSFAFTNAYKSKAYLKFSLSGIGSISSAVLRVNAYSNCFHFRQIQSGATTYDLYDATLELYVVSPATFPDWLSWTTGTLLATFLATDVTATVDIASTTYTADIVLPASIINSYAGQDICLVLVNADEKLDLELPFPGGQYPDSEDKQIRWYQLVNPNNSQLALNT
jgi:hypothetical protein